MELLLQVANRTGKCRVSDLIATSYKPILIRHLFLSKPARREFKNQTQNDYQVFSPCVSRREFKSQIPQKPEIDSQIHLILKKADLRTSLCILRGWFLNPRLINIGVNITNRKLNSCIPNNGQKRFFLI